MAGKIWYKSESALQKRVYKVDLRSLILQASAEILYLSAKLSHVSPSHSWGCLSNPVASCTSFNCTLLHQLWEERHSMSSVISDQIIPRVNKEHLTVFLSVLVVSWSDVFSNFYRKLFANYIFMRTEKFQSIRDW